MVRCCPTCSITTFFSSVRFERKFPKVSAGIAITPSFSTRAGSSISIPRSRFVARSFKDFSPAIKRTKRRTGSESCFPVKRSAVSNAFLRLSFTHSSFILLYKILIIVITGGDMWRAYVPCCFVRVYQVFFCCVLCVQVTGYAHRSGIIFSYPQGTPNTTHYFSTQPLFVSPYLCTTIYTTTIKTTRGSDRSLARVGCLF